MTFSKNNEHLSTSSDAIASRGSQPPHPRKGMSLEEIAAARAAVSERKTQNKTKKEIFGSQDNKVFSQDTFVRTKKV